MYSFRRDASCAAFLKTPSEVGSMVRQSSHGTLSRNLSSPSLKASSSSTSLGLRRNASASTRTGSSRREKTSMHQQEDFDRLPPEQQWWELEARRLLEVTTSLRATRMQLQSDEEAAKEKCANLKRQFEESKAEAESCTRNVQIAMDAIGRWEAKNKEIRPLYEKTQAAIDKKQDEVDVLQSEVDNLQKQLQMLELQIEHDQSRCEKAEAQESFGNSADTSGLRGPGMSAAAQEDGLAANSHSAPPSDKSLELGGKAKESLSIAANTDGRASTFVDAKTALTSPAPTTVAEDSLSQQTATRRPEDDPQAATVKALCARMKTDLIAALKAGSLAAGFSGFNKPTSMDAIENQEKPTARSNEGIANVSFAGESEVSERVKRFKQKDSAGTKKSNPKAKAFDSPKVSSRSETAASDPARKAMSSKALSFESAPAASDTVLTNDSSPKSNTQRTVLKKGASSSGRGSPDVVPESKALPKKAIGRTGGARSASPRNASTRAKSATANA